jgi:arsenate reductase (thioredoxin)
MLKIFFFLMLMQPIEATSEHGLFVRSLWLLQQYGTQAATDARNDVGLKSALAKAIAKDSTITFNEVREYMSSEKFQEIAGKDHLIDSKDIANALDSCVPASRAKLNPKVRAHAEYLTTTFDMIDEEHRDAAQRLANWIVSNFDSNSPLDVIVVCTGNSRRSILGSSMGNVAAAYYGLSNIRFHSGGTAPSAFNSRSITALKEVGFSIDATGAEATRGDPMTANPVYRVSWGEDLASTEFSKHYSDKINPQLGFGALMVCTEADAGCPIVAGAAIRISMPYLDPKLYDDSSLEAIKYAERRDDIGRTMLSALGQARAAIDAKQK